MSPPQSRSHHSYADIKRASARKAAKAGVAGAAEKAEEDSRETNSGLTGAAVEAEEGGAPCAVGARGSTDTALVEAVFASAAEQHSPDPDPDSDTLVGRSAPASASAEVHTAHAALGGIADAPSGETPCMSSPSPAQTSIARTA